MSNFEKKKKKDQHWSINNINVYAENNKIIFINNSLYLDIPGDSEMGLGQCHHLSWTHTDSGVSHQPLLLGSPADLYHAPFPEQ